MVEIKAVLISIKPKWVEKIASGKKTVEVRKTKPKIDVPFKCYIYETKAQFIKSVKGACTSYGYGRGKVVGEFVCDRVNHLNGYWLNGEDNLKETTCHDDAEIMDYIEYIDRTFHLWHISELKIYDKPKDLREFRKPCDVTSFAKCYPDNCDRCHWNTLTRPPQSWCYVEEMNE